MNSGLIKKIEGLLFANGDPIGIHRLAKLTDSKPKEIKDALRELDHILEDRGIVLVQKNNDVMLATSPDIEDAVSILKKDELQKLLGKAGLETLTIVLYKGPVTKSEINYIRGVDSSSVLRNLLIRGLVERKENPSNRRSFIYETTTDTLLYLGLRNLKDLPEYEKIHEHTIEEV